MSLAYDNDNDNGLRHVPIPTETSRLVESVSPKFNSEIVAYSQYSYPAIVCFLLPYGFFFALEIRKRRPY